MTPSSPPKPSDATLASVLRRAAAALSAAGVSDAQRDARLLARHAFGLDGPGLLVAESAPPEPDGLARFDAAVARRARRAPLSHIVGTRQFYGRAFRIDGRALDPRPESETLVAAALAALSAVAEPRLLDLGVGSGCLLLTLLAERTDASGLGIDASADALALAAENAAALAVADRLELRRGDWLDGVDERFDAVLCNPPYIAEQEIATLAPEVRDHEPIGALTPGGDGLDVYRRLAPAIGEVLKPSAQAFFEIGRGQADAATAPFRAAGLSVSHVADAGGVARVLVVCRP